MLGRLKTLFLLLSIFIAFREGEAVQGAEDVYRSDCVAGYYAQAGFKTRVRGAPFCLSGDTVLFSPLNHQASHNYDVKAQVCYAYCAAFAPHYNVAEVRQMVVVDYPSVFQLYENGKCYCASRAPGGNGAGCSSTTSNDKYNVYDVKDCAACPAGKWSDQTGQTSCKTCTAGKYQDQTGKTSCKGCEYGKYQNQNGKNSCKNCPGGYHQNNPNMVNCKACGVGHGTAAGTEWCTNCAKGKYQDQSKQSSCKTCASGKYTDQTEQSSCKSCPNGWGHLDSREACSQCVAGKFKSGNICSDCPKGWYQNDAEEASCKLCDTGKYQDQTGRTSHTSCKNCQYGRGHTASREMCELCSAGKYYSSAGCSDCVAGRYQDLEGRDSCPKCDHAFYQDETGKTGCKGCPTGWISTPNDGTRAECFKCAPGRYTTGNFLGWACSHCDAGNYQDLYGATSCKTCEVGKYQHELGQEVCNECDAGMYQAATGGISCVNCPVGYFSGVRKAALSCKSCGSDETPEKSVWCSGGFTFKDLTSLKSAVEDWFVNANAAATMYGHISAWDVSEIVNMDGLFLGRDLSDIDLSLWKTSSLQSADYMFGDDNTPSTYTYGFCEWDVTRVFHLKKLLSGLDVENMRFCDPSWMRGDLYLNNMMYENRDCAKCITETPYTFGMRYDDFVRPSFGEKFIATDANIRDAVANTMAGNDDGTWSHPDHGPISEWDTSQVTDMSYLFLNLVEFSADISRWETGSVTSMRGMFEGTQHFDMYLDWDTSSVLDMRDMFKNSIFSHGLPWDTSSVTDMTGMLPEMYTVFPLGNAGSDVRHDYEPLSFAYSLFGMTDASFYSRMSGDEMVYDSIKISVGRDAYIPSATACTLMSSATREDAESWGLSTSYSSGRKGYVSGSSVASLTAEENTGRTHAERVARCRVSCNDATSFYMRDNGACLCSSASSLVSVKAYERVALADDFFCPPTFSVNTLVADADECADHCLYPHHSDDASFSGDGFWIANNARSMMVSPVGGTTQFECVCVSNEWDECGTDTDTFTEVSSKVSMLQKKTGVKVYKLRMEEWFEEHLFVPYFCKTCDTDCDYEPLIDFVADTEFPFLVYSVVGSASDYVYRQCPDGYEWNEVACDLCNRDTYWVRGRCMACPFGTISTPGALRCTSVLTNDNIQAAVDSYLMTEPDPSDYATELAYYNAKKRYEDPPYYFGPISEWNTYRVTNMSGLFKGRVFDEDIRLWDVSNVEDMSEMFLDSTFSGDVRRWNVNRVKNFDRMFHGSAVTVWHGWGNQDGTPVPNDYEMRTSDCFGDYRHITNVAECRGAHSALGRTGPFTRVSLDANINERVCYAGHDAMFSLDQSYVGMRCSSVCGHSGKVSVIKRREGFSCYCHECMETSHIPITPMRFTILEPAGWCSHFDVSTTETEATITECFSRCKGESKQAAFYRGDQCACLDYDGTCENRWSLNSEFTYLVAEKEVTVEYTPVSANGMETFNLRMEGYVGTKLLLEGETNIEMCRFRAKNGMNQVSPVREFMGSGTCSGETPCICVKVHDDQYAEACATTKEVYNNAYPKNYKGDGGAVSTAFSGTVLERRTQCEAFCSATQNSAGQDATGFFEYTPNTRCYCVYSPRATWTTHAAGKSSGTYEFTDPKVCAMYIPITTAEECEWAVNKLGYTFDDTLFDNAMCSGGSGEEIRKLPSVYAVEACEEGKGVPECHLNGRRCLEGSDVEDGVCYYTNENIHVAVKMWDALPEGYESLYGVFTQWEVGRVTDMTGLFEGLERNPDIRNWDLRSLGVMDRMFKNSGFNYAIDLFDLPALSSAEETFDGSAFTLSGYRACGLRFVRAGAKVAGSVIGANGLANCIVDTSIRGAVIEWFGSVDIQFEGSDMLVGGRLSPAGSYEISRGTAIEINSDTPIDIGKANVDNNASFSFEFQDGYWSVTTDGFASGTRDIFRGVAPRTYGPMSDWDVSEVTDMSYLFYGRRVTERLASWNTESVVNMVSMFENSQYDEDIRHWNVVRVKNFGAMFKGGTIAQDLTRWQFRFTMHHEMFEGNSNYRADSSLEGNVLLSPQFDSSTLRTAVDMWFSNREQALEEYKHISDWRVYAVTDMSELFKHRDLKDDISRWVVSSVTSMRGMFEGSTFNGDISDWSVINVEDMSNMFKDSKFNSPIRYWNVSKVRDMSGMFQNSVFNQYIGDWELYATSPDKINVGINQGCESNVNEVVPYPRGSLEAKLFCFDYCNGNMITGLRDVEGRDRDRSAGAVGEDETPNVGFTLVTDEAMPHTCHCHDSACLKEAELTAVPRDVRCDPVDSNYIVDVYHDYDEVQEFHLTTLPERTRLITSGICEDYSSTDYHGNEITWTRVGGEEVYLAPDHHGAGGYPTSYRWNNVGADIKRWFSGTASDRKKKCEAFCLETPNNVGEDATGFFLRGGSCFCVYSPKYSWSWGEGAAESSGTYAFIAEYDNIGDYYMPGVDFARTRVMYLKTELRHSEIETNRREVSQWDEITGECIYNGKRTTCTDQPGRRKYTGFEKVVTGELCHRTKTEPLPIGHRDYTFIFQKYKCAKWGVCRSRYMGFAGCSDWRPNECAEGYETPEDKRTYRNYDNTVDLCAEECRKTEGCEHFGAIDAPDWYPDGHTQAVMGNLYGFCFWIKDDPSTCQVAEKFKGANVGKLFNMYELTYDYFVDIKIETVLAPGWYSSIRGTGVCSDDHICACTEPAHEVQGATTSEVPEKLVATTTMVHNTEYPKNYRGVQTWGWTSVSTWIPGYYETKYVASYPNAVSKTFSGTVWQRRIQCEAFCSATQNSDGHDATGFFEYTPNTKCHCIYSPRATWTTFSSGSSGTYAFIDPNTDIKKNLGRSPDSRLALCLNACKDHETILFSEHGKCSCYTRYDTSIDRPLGQFEDDVECEVNNNDEYHVNYKAGRLQDGKTEYSFAQKRDTAVQPLENVEFGWLKTGGRGKCTGDVFDDLTFTECKAKCNTTSGCKAFSYECANAQKNSVDYTYEIESVDIGGATKLDVCQGVCFDDDDCASGLKCFERSGDAPPPPGCEGEMISGLNYCYDPGLCSERSVCTLDYIGCEYAGDFIEDDYSIRYTLNQRYLDKTEYFRTEDTGARHEWEYSVVVTPVTKTLTNCVKTNGVVMTKQKCSLFCEDNYTAFTLFEDGTCDCGDKCNGDGEFTGTVYTYGVPVEDSIVETHMLHRFGNLNTENMFSGNDAFTQSLCGIGWRYRDLSSLDDQQRFVAFSCDVCEPGEHMSTCGLCVGEFEFDRCSPSKYMFSKEYLEAAGAWGPHKHVWSSNSEWITTSGLFEPNGVWERVNSWGVGVWHESASENVLLTNDIASYVEIQEGICEDYGYASLTVDRCGVGAMSVGWHGYDLRTPRVEVTGEHLLNEPGGCIYTNELIRFNEISGVSCSPEKRCVCQTHKRLTKRKALVDHDDILDDIVLKCIDTAETDPDVLMQECTSVNAVDRSSAYGYGNYTGFSGENMVAAVERFHEFVHGDLPLAGVGFCSDGSYKKREECESVQWVTRCYERCDSGQCLVEDHDDCNAVWIGSYGELSEYSGYDLFVALNNPVEFNYSGSGSKGLFKGSDTEMLYHLTYQESDATYYESLETTTRVSYCEGFLGDPISQSSTTVEINGSFYGGNVSCVGTADMDLALRTKVPVASSPSKYESGWVPGFCYGQANTGAGDFYKKITVSLEEDDDGVSSLVSRVHTGSGLSRDECLNRRFEYCSDTSKATREECESTFWVDVSAEMYNNWLGHEHDLMSWLPFWEVSDDTCESRGGEFGYRYETVTSGTCSDAGMDIVPVLECWEVGVSEFGWSGERDWNSVISSSERPHGCVKDLDVYDYNYHEVSPIACSVDNPCICKSKHVECSEAMPNVVEDDICIGHEWSYSELVFEDGYPTEYGNTNVDGLYAAMNPHNLDKTDHLIGSFTDVGYPVGGGVTMNFVSSTNTDRKRHDTCEFFCHGHENGAGATATGFFFSSSKCQCTYSNPDSWTSYMLTQDEVCYCPSCYSSSCPNYYKQFKRVIRRYKTYRFADASCGIATDCTYRGNSVSASSREECETTFSCSDSEKTTEESCLEKTCAGAAGLTESQCQKGRCISHDGDVIVSDADGAEDCDSISLCTDESLSDVECGQFSCSDGISTTQAECESKYVEDKPSALCSCIPEDGDSCYFVNNRKHVRSKEFYVNGVVDFSGVDKYHCELPKLYNRRVVPRSGFGAQTCTSDASLDYEECDLVGGVWEDNACSKCLAPCEGVEDGLKLVSRDRECKLCSEVEPVKCAGEICAVVDNECVLCPSGQFTNNNFPLCGSCPSGTYGHDGVCSTCPVGRFSGSTGMSACVACPENTFSVASMCVPCELGFISPAESGSCEETCHCWVGETVSDCNGRYGNLCESCYDGYVSRYGTCVAECVNGEYSTGTCQCRNMWTHSENTTLPQVCDTCYFPYSMMEDCADVRCTPLFNTDCLGELSDGTLIPVTGTDFWFDNRVVQQCTDVNVYDCMCTYTVDEAVVTAYAPFGTSCIVDGDNQGVFPECRAKTALEQCDPTKCPQGTLPKKEASCHASENVVEGKKLEHNANTKYCGNAEVLTLEGLTMDQCHEKCIQGDFTGVYSISGICKCVDVSCVKHYKKVADNAQCHKEGTRQMAAGNLMECAGACHDILAVSFNWNSETDTCQCTPYRFHECFGDYSVLPLNGVDTYELFDGFGEESDFHFFDNPVEAFVDIKTIVNIGYGACDSKDYKPGGSCCSTLEVAAEAGLGYRCGTCSDGSFRPTLNCTATCKVDHSQLLNYWSLNTFIFGDYVFDFGGLPKQYDLLKRHIGGVDGFRMNQFNDPMDLYPKTVEVALLETNDDGIINAVSVVGRDRTTTLATRMDLYNINRYKVLMSDTYRFERTAIESMTLSAFEMFGSTWRNGHCVPYRGHVYKDIISFSACADKCKQYQWCLGFSYDEFYDSYTKEWSDWKYSGGTTEVKWFRDLYGMGDGSSFKERIQRVVGSVVSGVCKLSNTRCEYEDEYTMEHAEKIRLENVPVIKEYGDDNGVIQDTVYHPFWSNRGSKRYTFGRYKTNSDTEIQCNSVIEEGEIAVTTKHDCTVSDLTRGGQCCGNYQKCSETGYECLTGVLVDGGIPLNGKMFQFGDFQKRCCALETYEYSTTDCVFPRCIDCDVPDEVVTERETCISQFGFIGSLRSMCDDVTSQCMFAGGADLFPSEWKMVNGKCVYVVDGEDYTLCRSRKFV